MANAQNIAFVACRILALYILYQALFSFVSLLLFSLQDTLSERFVAISHPALPLAVQLFAFSVFWYGANWISARVINERPADHDPTQWSRHDILSIAASIMGIFIVVTALPGLLSTINTLVNARAGFSVSLVYPVASILFGILLIIGSKSFTNLIVKLRRW